MRLDLDSNWTLKSGELAVIPSLPPACFTSARPEVLMYADDADVFTFGYKDFLQGPNKRVTKRQCLWNQNKGC